MEETLKNTVKIYKGEDEIPTFIIESENVIDATKWTSLWSCKEEIYIDGVLTETIQHNEEVLTEEVLTETIPNNEEVLTEETPSQTIQNNE